VLCRDILNHGHSGVAAAYWQLPERAGGAGQVPAGSDRGQECGWPRTFEMFGEEAGGREAAGAEDPGQVEVRPAAS